MESKYVNLEKFLAGLYEDSSRMFREETFKAMIHDLADYLVKHLKGCKYEVKAEVGYLFYDVLDFLVHRSDIPLGDDDIWNTVHNVYKEEECAPPVVEFCKACQLDGIDLDYDKLED